MVGALAAKKQLLAPQKIGLEHSGHNFEPVPVSKLGLVLSLLRFAKDNFAIEAVFAPQVAVFWLEGTSHIIAHYCSKRVLRQVSHCFRYLLTYMVTMCTVT